MHLFPSTTSHFPISNYCYNCFLLRSLIELTYVLGDLQAFCTMSFFRSARTNSRPSSKRSESLIKRTPSGTPAPDLHRKRVTTNGRSSPTASQSSTFQRTPSGTPAPIPPRTIDIVPQPQEDIDDDTYDHRILAFDKINRNTVGCSYYVAQDGVLYCMEDVKDADKDIFDICGRSPG